MLRRPPRSNRTDTLFPSTTLCRSIEVTGEGVDKAYGLERLSCESGIPLDAMLFVGDAIFPGGNDYPAKLLGLDTICVRDPREALSVIAAIVACLADRH